RLEVVDLHTERGKTRTIDLQPGIEVVVGKNTRVAGLRPVRDDDGLALVGVHLTDRHGNDDAQQREVEHQVPGLPQEASLGADTTGAVLVFVLRTSPAPQPGARRRQHLVGVRRQVRAGMMRQPGEVTWRPDGFRADRANVVPAARHEAADQRNHQQQVDRREPHTGVDAEELQGVQHLGPPAVLVQILRDLVRVHRLLRQEGAGKGGQGEQEKQDQRRPHRRQPTPGVADRRHHTPAARGAMRAPWARTRWAAGGRLGSGHRGSLTSETNDSRSHPTNSAHSPDTSSTPTSRSMPPPTSCTRRELRRSQSVTRTIQRAPTAMSRNGRPRPRQYNSTRKNPRAAAPPVELAITVTAASVGPRHGVHPRPNTIPSMGAPHTPARGTRRKRYSRCAQGMKPRNAKASAMINTPPMRCSSPRVTAMTSVNHTTPPSPMVSTTVNPATNNAAAPTTANRRRPDCGSPVTPGVSAPTNAA